MQARDLGDRRLALGQCMIGEREAEKQIAHPGDSGPLQWNQGWCIPEPMHLSRRDHQGAATLPKTRRATVTLVSL